MCGFAAGVHVPPSTPSSQVSFGTNTNSTAVNSTIAGMQRYHLLHLYIILLIYVMVSQKEINYQKIVRTHQLG